MFHEFLAIFKVLEKKTVDNDHPVPIEELTDEEDEKDEKTKKMKKMKKMK